MSPKTNLVRGKFILPLMALAIGVALSITLGLAAHREIASSAQQRFDALTIEVSRKVEGRIDNYVEVLAGLRARFTAAQVANMHLRGYDEIQSYWLCKPAPADEACQFMAAHMVKPFSSPVEA